jgi:hypothetical protein
VTGTSWLPNDRVTLLITPPRVQPVEQLRTSLRVRVDRFGNFRATITVPADNRLVNETVVWVTATGSRNTRALAPFALLPPPMPETPSPRDENQP